MDGLGGLVAIAPAHRAGDLGSNPGPGENFSLKILITIYVDIVNHFAFLHKIRERKVRMVTKN